MLLSSCFKKDLLLIIKKIPRGYASGLFITENTSTKTKNLQAKYHYYQHGALKRVELADNLQGMDYVYTINGMLKSINNPDGADPGSDGSGIHTNFAEDIFAMSLDYYKDDYVRTGTDIGNDASAANFDGNIAHQHYYNNATLPDTEDLQNKWSYTYDERNYLQEANYGFYSGTIFIPCNAFKVFGLGYDHNGNIMTLNRNDDLGYAMDRFRYEYNSSAVAINRLSRVLDAHGDAGKGDLGEQTKINNYIYNHIGQLTHDKYGKDGAGHRFRYNVYGLVTKVLDTEYVTIGEYVYDAQGFRVKKINHQNGITTWYTRDLSGNIMATYETANSTTELKEVPIYGSGRLGVANANGGVLTQYLYELSDHLGNVRATVTKNSGEIDIVTGADYYPFGMTMLGRTFNDGDYRFGYQGQFSEEDPETGYNAYEARLYDKRIGRWMIPDPARSHWSPYLAMGNNPIIFGDPDGRDIVILVAANGGMFGSGHMGMLIGSDANGWNYLSKEGTQGSYARAIIGGPPKPPELGLVQKGEGYATIDDFFKGMPNLTNTYTDAVLIEADAGTDAKMLDRGLEALYSRNHFYTNNCTDAVGEALVAGGFNPGQHPTSFYLPAFPNNRLPWMQWRNNGKTINIPKTPSIIVEPFGNFDADGNWVEL